MENKLKQLLEQTKYSITLEINHHKDCYQTVEEYMREFPHEDYLNDEDLSQEVYDKMVETDTIISLQVYPRTPGGFYKIYGYDLDMVLNEALS